jgi:8-oxo-dGTP pyrophosphatase MutT (NUDIX family)
VIEHAAAIDRLRARLRTASANQAEYDGHRAAAVAVLLVDRGGVTHVPFTVRSDSLPSHSGQISFPGGTRDPDDGSFALCALRETREELGLSSHHIRVLGELDDVPTPTGYTIRPVVAELDPAGAIYQPNPREVVEVFEQPLSAFADPAFREDLGAREYRGIHYRIHAYNLGGRRIWGATARMVEQLVELLR